MNDIEEQYEKARIYLLSIIDNKKNKAMTKKFEILEDKNATRYTLFEDKENPANLEEFHYPSFKEDMIEELDKLMSEVSDLAKRHPSMVLSQGMSSKQNLLMSSTMMKKKPLKFSLDNLNLKRNSNW